MTYFMKALLMGGASDTYLKSLGEKKFQRMCELHHHYFTIV